VEGEGVRAVDAQSRWGLGLAGTVGQRNGWSGKEMGIRAGRRGKLPVSSLGIEAGGLGAGGRV
jgi:hypothetical protein